MSQNTLNAKTPFLLYLLIWQVYYFQGLLRISGVLSQIMLVLVLTISFYYMYLAISKFHLPKLLYLLTFMLFVFSIYGVINIIIGSSHYISENIGATVKSWVYLKNIYISFLPVYAVYAATKLGRFTESDFRVVTLILLALNIGGFYYVRSTEIANFGQEEITNNAAYDMMFFIILLPLFYKRPMLQYAILFICIYYTMTGMKRGALVCGSAAILWFFIASLKGNKRKRHRMQVVLLSIFAIFFIVSTFSQLSGSSDYFNNRLERTVSGDSSNRDYLYALLLSHFIYENNIFSFLFGNGADATIFIAGNYAHNDWLELAIDCGLFMVVIYTIYWARMIKTTIQARKTDEMCYMILGLFFITQFLRTFFSMGYSNIPLHCSMALGYALARLDDKNNIIDTH